MHKDYIKQNILPLAQHDGVACRPLHAITYAIKNILHPTFLYGQIPDLLLLLFHADLVRQRLKDNVDTILTWDTYYKDEQYKNSGVTALTDRERRSLEIMQGTLQRDLRHMYCRVVNGLSLVVCRQLCRILSGLD